MYSEAAAPSIVVGLGNPGAAYRGSLHNLGRDWTCALAERLGATFSPSKRFAGQLAKANADGHSLSLYLPDAWMNETGPPVARLVRGIGCPAQSLLVVHDEMDLPAGALRLKFGGGDAGHKGLGSIRIHLGTGDYWRLRLGIGSGEGGERGAGFVLSRPPPQKRLLLQQAVERSVQVLSSSFHRSWDQVMQQLHGPPPEPPASA